MENTILVCSGCLTEQSTVNRDMFDGLCVDCTEKALYNYDFAKAAEQRNKSLKNKL